VHALSPEAETALVAHGWPGNVRELQNCLMRAVILSDEAILRSSDLVFGEGSLSTREPAGGERPRPPLDAAERARAVLSRPLQTLLGHVAARDAPLPPLGAWIQDELVRRAGSRAGGVQRRAAALLGIAETTYRRQLATARARLPAPEPSWSAAWAEVTRALDELLQRLGPGCGDVGAACERVLLQLLGEHGLCGAAVGARLLGVSRPTFRRRLAELRRTS
jgi:transcriptional regulator with AAA-type ATPase domain